MRFIDIIIVLLPDSPCTTCETIVHLNMMANLISRVSIKVAYNNYSGREVFIDVGVRVPVKYDPAKKEQVTLDDKAAKILERNTQLKK